MRRVHSVYCIWKAKIYEWYQCQWFQWQPALHILNPSSSESGLCTYGGKRKTLAMVHLVAKSSVSIIPPIHLQLFKWQCNFLLTQLFVVKYFLMGLIFKGEEDRRKFFIKAAAKIFCVSGDPTDPIFAFHVIFLGVWHSSTLIMQLNFMIVSKHSTWKSCGEMAGVLHRVLVGLLLYCWAAIAACSWWY